MNCAELRIKRLMLCLSLTTRILPIAEEILLKIIRTIPITSKLPDRWSIRLLAVIITIPVIPVIMHSILLIVNLSSLKAMCEATAKTRGEAPIMMAAIAAGTIVMAV